MRNLGLAGLLGILCAPTPALAQPPPAGPAADWWLRAPILRSKYYAVKADLPQAEIAALAQHVDATFESYMGMFAKLPVRVQRPATLDLYLFANEQDYLQVLRARFNDDGAGSWGKCIGIGHSISVVGWRGEHTAEEMKPLLQHEGFHQVACHLFPGMPQWANEGLAELFERGVTVGGKLALGEFPERDKRQLIEAVQARTIVPLDRFFAISNERWNAQVRAGDATVAYLQAWSLVHFFVFTENGKYEKNFLGLLVQLNQNVDWKTAFVNAFGTPDFRAIEQKWLAYVQAAPPTDYRETLRRLDFLAAGMAKLRQDNVAPGSFEELKAGLEKVGFTHASEMFGEKRDLSAQQAEVFEVPPAGAGSGRRFALVDSRGRTPGDAPSRRDPAPLSIATVGLQPQMFVARWVKRGREADYVLESQPPTGAAAAREARTPHAPREEDMSPGRPGSPRGEPGADPPSADPRESGLRTWTSADGAHSTEARLVTFTGGVAVLKKPDGETIRVPYDQLAPADREFLDAWKKRK